VSSDFYVTEDNINLGILGSYLQTDFTSSEQAYKEEIVAWTWENLDLDINEKELSGQYDSGDQKPVSKIFKISVTPKISDIAESYLFIGEMENLLFSEDYGQIIQDGYWIIQLNGVSKEITFSTSENIEILNIPAFISPQISELTVIELEDSELEEDNSKSKQTLFLIVSFIVVIIGGIAWFIIQQWYNKKYETHLFRDRNNLYNLINYIHDSKKSGVEEKEISKSLKGNGWTNEQIVYALKKYKGKRMKTK
jgi:hypothetical protein